MTLSNHCPVCAESADSRELLLRTRCAKHLAECEPISDEAIVAAFEEGLRARKAALDAYIPPRLAEGLRFR